MAVVGPRGLRLGTPLWGGALREGAGGTGTPSPSQLRGSLELCSGELARQPFPEGQRRLESRVSLSLILQVSSQPGTQAEESQLRRVYNRGTVKLSGWVIGLTSWGP